MGTFDDLKQEEGLDTSPYSEDYEFTPTAAARTKGKFRDTLKAGAKAAATGIGIAMDWGTGAAPIRMAMHKVAGTPTTGENWFDVPGYEQELEKAGMAPGKLRSGLAMVGEVATDPGFIGGALAKSFRLAKNVGGRNTIKAIRAAEAAGNMGKAEKLSGKIIDRGLPLQIKTPAGEAVAAATTPPPPSGTQLPLPMGGSNVIPFKRVTKIELPEDVATQTFKDYEMIDKGAYKPSKETVAEKLLSIPSKALGYTGEKYYGRSMDTLTDRAFSYGKEDELRKLLLKRGIGSTGKKGAPVIEDIRALKQEIGDEYGYAQQMMNKEAQHKISQASPEEVLALTQEHAKRVNLTDRAIRDSKIWKSLEKARLDNILDPLEETLSESMDIIQKDIASRGYLSPEAITSAKKHLQGKLFDKNAPGGNYIGGTQADAVRDIIYGAFRKLEDATVKDFTSPQFLSAYRDIAHDYSALSSITGGNADSVIESFVKAERGGSKLDSITSLAPLMASAYLATEGLSKRNPAYLAAAGVGGVGSLLGNTRLRRIGGSAMHKAASNPWSGAFLDTIARQYAAEKLGAKKGPKKVVSIPEPLGENE